MNFIQWGSNRTRSNTSTGLGVERLRGLRWNMSLKCWSYKVGAIEVRVLGLNSKRGWRSSVYRSNAGAIEVGAIEVGFLGLNMEAKMYYKSN